MNRYMKRTIMSLLSITMFVTSSINAAAVQAVNETPEIILNGTVEAGSDGYLSSKSVIISSNRETKVNYRLVPQYSKGATSGVRVYINLPSLEFVDGEYKVVAPGKESTPLGVQGTVSAGGGWNVLSDTTVKGGTIVMEYDGDLGSGTNPAFNILLTTYNDGSDGVYGSVPEGTSFEINGFVEYDMYNRVPGSEWITPNGLDNESRVSIISSDLKWEAGIESYVEDGESDLVPIWDRYQYIDYVYTVENTSDNLASNIDGYSVTFDIDSTDSMINGIIPFDINRWKHVEGGSPEANDNPDYTSGEFVGVPGKGGVLVYDITDWDGESPLGESIPYTYSGAGMIVVNRERGDYKKELTPEGVDGHTENKYLISLPLSRQGFPNPPTKFKVVAITNILFAKTANWSKTDIVEREIALPTYEMSYEHTAEKKDVVFGYETFLSIKNIENKSNASIHSPVLNYSMNPDFNTTKVEIIVSEDIEISDYIDELIKYKYTDDKTGELVEGKITEFTTSVENGVKTITFDTELLHDALDWNREISFNLKGRMKTGEKLPFEIRVYGTPHKVGVMTQNSDLIFIEKIASNDDLGNNTSYTEVEHSLELPSSFNVIYPKEVAAVSDILVKGATPTSSVEYLTPSIIDFRFGLNDTTADRVKYTAILNTNTIVAKDVEIRLNDVLFEDSSNIRISILTENDGIVELDIPENYNGESLDLKGYENEILEFIVETDEFTSKSLKNYISMTASFGSGITRSHVINSKIETYQKEPYDKTKTVNAQNRVTIVLPKEVVATSNIQVDGKTATSSVNYLNPSVINFNFGLNDTTADKLKFEAVLNTDSLFVVKNVDVRLNEVLFEDASDIKVSILTESDGLVELIIPEGYSGEALDLRGYENEILSIVVETGKFSSSSIKNYITVNTEFGEGIIKTHVIKSSVETYQEVPYDKTKIVDAQNRVTIVLPNEVVPRVDIFGIYGASRTKNKTNVSYESIFSAEFMLTTGGVNSPTSEYKMGTAKATKTGFLGVQSVRVEDILLESSDSAKLVFRDSKGDEQSFDISEGNQVVDLSQITLGDIESVTLVTTNLLLATSVNVVTIDYKAGIEIGSTQALTANFTGTQELPHVAIKVASAQNVIEIRETKTTVKVEGVNQVTQPLGAGNKYSMEVYKYYYYNSSYRTSDYTLDQGYKSLGGFTSTITRPTAAIDNNNQKTNVSVKLPYEHFDLYYLKIRDEMKPYITEVDIYRMVDGEEVLWQTVEGSDWTYNTEEQKFWRINTALESNKGSDLFLTYDSRENAAEHPYFKNAWHEDVRPETPVSRVDVKLNFERLSNTEAPQMSGTHNDIVEYMGRFYATSEKGKKATTLTTTDTFGTDIELERSAATSINSLVQYPFAQGSTGSQDSTILSNKVILMGRTGEFLTSVWNTNTAGWNYYRGHGPDVYIPAATEYDEWLGLYNPAGFHDKLIHEFVYPENELQNDTYYYDSEYFTIHNTSSLNYLSNVKVYYNATDFVSIDIEKEDNSSLKFNYVDGDELGIVKETDGTYSISLGGKKPVKVEALLVQVPGFGENTAEIDGVNPDTLGTNLNEVDIRFGGRVFGNKALKGTTNLYRVPEDTNKRTLMHTSSSTLTGYTPKLGASLGMTFDNLKMYDYKADGITPNQSKVTLDIWNSSEADIKDINLKFTPDANFRSEKLEIPATIFKGVDWSVSKFVINQGSKVIEIDLDRFVLNSVTNMYELDISSLFEDKTLDSTTVKSSINTDISLIQKKITSMTATFNPKDETVALWGTLSQELTEDKLPIRMIDGGSMFITGNWVDESVDGEEWNSKPTFVADTKKASNEQIQANSQFNVSAELTSYQTMFVTAGGGNAGQRPTLTPTVTQSPRLYSRVARLVANSKYIKPDLSTFTGGNAIFSDKDSKDDIYYNSLTTGDTVKVLYEVRSEGKVATGDLTPGNTPVRNPKTYIDAPKGFIIKDYTIVTEEFTQNESLNKLYGQSTYNPLNIMESNISVEETKSSLTISYNDVVMNENDSIIVYVEFETDNTYNKDNLYATQNQVPNWTIKSRPGYTHNFLSYDVAVDAISGQMLSRLVDGSPAYEKLSSYESTGYRFANPSQTEFTLKFDKENISGETITLTTEGVKNKILHDNTQIELIYTLDKNKLGGFELTKVPTPEYPNGFNGSYDKPQVLYKNGSGEWVNFKDIGDYDMKLINEIKVDYGIVSRYHNDADWEAPSFEVKGIAHWRALSSKTTKTYVIQSEMVFDYTTYEGEEVGAKFKTTNQKSISLYKAIPISELNIQSFDTKEESLAKYNSANIGKVSYRPGDDIYYRITALNHSTFEGLSTTTPYGKAPLLNPVIFDKIPEYLTSDIMNYVSNGVFDVEAALAAGVITIQIEDNQGNIRDIVNPTVTVKDVKGLDIAGSQQFANDRQNDRWGLLSSAQPIDTKKNPADEINFKVFEYKFENDSIGRGETLTIAYKATVRENDLPMATYPNGKPVYAPLNGWYSLNNPISTNAGSYTMDMASLLHDVGLSGDKGHEMESQEFLTNSYAWMPGTNVARRNATDTNTLLATFYDYSANKESVHSAYLKEELVNEMYQSATSNAKDESFVYATKGRVNDGQVTHNERILWAQDGVQLSRAWVYGASEMVTDKERATHGVDSSNFYEEDKELNNYNLHRLGITPYVSDAYTYAVELYEEFTMKLHGVNMGDYSVMNGMKYTSILPLGVTPYGEDGELLGIKAFNANLETENFTYEVIQTPESDKGYRAPAQSQEGNTYSDKTRDDMIPYVIQVTIKDELKSRFSSESTSDKYQRVELRVRIYEELAPSTGDISLWHDQLTVEPVENEAYYEIYDKSYGGFDVAPSQNYSNHSRYPNHGMKQGLELNDTYYGAYSYGMHFSYEPYGMYIRGLNAQGTRVIAEGDKKTHVTGDQIAMRKPTLRVWSKPVKDSYQDAYDKSIQDFSVDLYDEFTINSTVENQQLEVLGEYNRVNSGYNRYSGDKFNNDIWVNAPQTIGGARGTWFEPSNTIVLPYGIAPIMKDGTIARYYQDTQDYQNVDFGAVINDITFQTSTLNKEVTDYFDVEVSILEDELGKRFVLKFTTNTPKSSDVAYGQSLVISPRVAVIDTPLHESELEGDGSKYQQILTFANSTRNVFNPIVSDRYTTGSPVTRTARDLGNTTGNNIKSSNGLSIAQNDRQRPDSMSEWSSNMGVLKITERLISATHSYNKDSDIKLSSSVSVKNWIEKALIFMNQDDNDKHDKSGAFGGTTLNVRNISIHNETKTMKYHDSIENENTQVDASGKYWYSTEIKNEITKNINPYEEFKTSGDVHSLRFVVTQVVTKFVNPTDNTRIKVGDKTLTRSEYEALGYTVELIELKDSDVDSTRKRIQWVVTTPENDQGARGFLANGDSFKFLYEVIFVDGYEDNIIDEEDVWISDELIVDSYVSLISGDESLIEGEQKPEDFIIQDIRDSDYHTMASDKVAKIDIDMDGSMDTKYAHDDARIEILKPKVEIRKNTVRPRIPYSNGNSGDSYFNSSDVIEYMLTYGKITGSGLRELVIEDILPTHKTNDSTINTSRMEITTNTQFVTTGKWLLPQETLDRINASGKSIDDIFRTFVYVSELDAEDGYEVGDEWKLLNEGGSSILTNTKINIPTEMRQSIKKIRVVVRSLDPDNYLVDKGTRLDVDADPEMDGVQEVIDIDPNNHSTEQYSESVVDNSVKIGMRISSDAKTTLFVHNTMQAWANFVGDAYAKVDQSEVRSYLTPSRPVVNVKYNTLYYRSDSTKPQEERFGWSDITTISPKSSPHLKFKGEFINADSTMWSEDESNIYSSDTLINPFVTFQLPSVMETGADFKYVDYESIDETHPLHNDHRSRYSLTTSDSNQWTWKIVRVDGSESYLKHTDFYAGPWAGSDRNIVSVWFEGIIYPGDSIQVEFIGEVNAYEPGVDSDSLKSKAMVTNNTGLLQPLNSRMNNSNRLGYTLDDNDFNKNKLSNDRLVFAERSMFQYETYDNFGKRKLVYSDLNMAGTTYPELTPIREGGLFTYDVTVDNSKDSQESPYPYPIIYDVLPHSGDTSIIDKDSPRESQYSAWIDASSINLKREGSMPKEYSDSEYTVYVGPFTKDGSKIVETDMPTHDEAKSQEFYESLEIPSKKSPTRDKYFVKLSEIQGDKEMLKKVKSVLVLLNDAKAELPGQSKLTLNYSMKSPLNAPVLLENGNGNKNPLDFALWNSFVATQNVDRFIPQESNRAGSYVVEKEGLTSIGNYVWNDVDYDGVVNEGDVYVDSNGRKLLKPSKDLNYDGSIDDPGINGVKVLLLSDKGYNADIKGQPIHFEEGEWRVVDESTGKSVLDEVFLKPIVSEGPLYTYTEEDINGNNGYYIFSNIPSGSYRVAFEFGADHDVFSVTTKRVMNSKGIAVYEPGKDAGVKAELDINRLVAVSELFSIDENTSDEDKMSFKIGVAQSIEVGGTIFKENLKTLNGLYDKTESGLEGYHVYLKDMNGKTVVSPEGDEMVTITDENGEYRFKLLPINREYYIEVRNENNEFSYETVVSPILHNINPFESNLDNDGYTVKGVEEIRTNTLGFDLEGMFKDGFKDRFSVSVGLYDKTTYGVIGNRVWNDINRDGIQDSNEPGVAGQELQLEQYIMDNGEWVKTTFNKKTTSNIDGYYYFTEVPSVYTVGTGANAVSYETKYQVVVDKLVEGFTFTLTNQRESDDLDNDFFRNGKMHLGLVGDNLISVADNEGGITMGRDVNNVDLGLTKHSLSSIEGLIFMDENSDGLNNDKLEPEEYNILLEVLYNGKWVSAKVDENGMMIEPRLSKSGDTDMFIEGASSYKFENLHIIDNKTLTPYQYRVVVNEIPLWNGITLHKVGDDKTIDNDFVFKDRGRFVESESEEYILGELVSDELTIIDTYGNVEFKNIDLGLRVLKTSSIIGDYIWYDFNQNGIQDAGERGISNLKVVVNKLVNGELIYVDETVTDESGRYEFTLDVANFDPESDEYNKEIEYVVEFNMTSRQSLSPLMVGSNDKVDSNFEKLYNKGKLKYKNNIEDPKHTAVSVPFTLSELDDNGFVDYETTRDDLSIDGGVLVHDSVRSIGTTMYYDTNLNGKQDLGELGIEGLKVNLYRYNKQRDLYELFEDLDGNSSLITNEFGKYEFNVEVADLEKDSPYYMSSEKYKVMVEAPSNYKMVEIDNFFKYQDSKYIDGIDIDRPSSYILTDEIILVNDMADENAVDLLTAHDELLANAGFEVYETSVIIGGSVWLDSNDDGLQDIIELPIKDKEITLWKKVDGEWVIHEDLNGSSTVKTDKNGYYEFEVSPTNYDELSDEFLSQFEYKVTAERNGYEKWSKYEEGSIISIDSNIKELQGHTGHTNVFDISNTIGKSEILDVSSVKDDVNMGIGIVEYRNTVVIGGLSWNDENHNGLQEDSENVISGDVVYLWRLIDGVWTNVSDVNGVSQQKTNNDGEYRFEVAPTSYDLSSDDYLIPYEYKVSSERLGNELWSPIRVGEDKTIDSNIKLADEAEMSSSEHIGSTDMFDISKVLESGLMDIESVKDDVQMDIGKTTYGTSVLIGGRVWIDENQDGIRDMKEYPVEDRVVTLWKFEDNSWIVYEDLNGNSSVVTGDDGKYLFNVPVTSYDESSSDYLVPYVYRTTIDREGYEGWTEINVGESMYVDSNISQVSKSNVDSVVGLPKSTHTGIMQEFNISKILKGGRVDVSSIYNDLTQDAGIVIHKNVVQIGGVVWNDENIDGIRNDDELDLEFREVNLWKKVDGEWVLTEDVNGVSTTYTNADGEYIFTVEPTSYDELSEYYLIPYEYKVTHTRNGYEKFTKYMEGNDIELDSNFKDKLYKNPQTGESDVFDIYTVNESGKIVLSSVKDDLTQGAGILINETNVIIGGTIWSDENQDGLRDDEEERLQFREVYLWKLVEGQWIPYADIDGLSSTMTNADGEYRFTVEPTEYNPEHKDYLIKNDYRVTTERFGWEVFTEEKVGEDITIDSNAGSSEKVKESGINYSKHTGVTDIFDIVEYEGKSLVVDVATLKDDVTQDVGIIKYDSVVKIGDYVWNDENENGVQDVEEHGIEGVNVYLERYDEELSEWVEYSDMNGISHVVTNTQGAYEFEVEPTNYDEESDGYLTPYRYRVKLEVPELMRETPGHSDIDDVNSDVKENLVGYLISREAVIADVNNGMIDVESIESDMDVDFGLVHIPTTPLFPIGPSEKLPEEVHPFPPGTGIKSLSNVYKVSIMISGVIVAVILLKKKDEKESK